MKIKLQNMLKCKKYLQQCIQLNLFFFAALLFLSNIAMADITSRMVECAQITGDAARLKCFDDLTGRDTPSKTVESAKITEDKPSPTPTIDRPSVMSRHWELDSLSRKSASIIRMHRSNYILPLAYNAQPNREPALDLDRQARSEHTEAKFQISFKLKLWEDIMNKDVDLWFAYTQLSFWQLYNSTFSSPFRETDYEPEVFLNFRTDYKPFGIDFLGLRGRVVAVGFDHQSNGRSEPLSRSWNRLVANLGFENKNKNLNLYVKGWYRIPESADEDDNPNIEKYMGHGELWGAYYWNKHRFAAMVRNNLRTSDNKGAVQIDWSFPIPFINNDRLSLYVQYFNGYGESLLDYNSYSNRASIGFMLADWN